MTAEQILNEIDDARANVRSVTLRTLKELSHRPASQKKQRRGSAKARWRECVWYGRV